MKSAVTINDIAEQLGLSRNTVAKALNGKYVPESTRKRVLAKARELDYKSMGAAQGEATRGKRSRILLLSGKPLNNINFFIPIIRGIENYCYERHHELFQYTFNDLVMTFSSFAEYVKSLEPDGIIAIETFKKDFIQRLIGLEKPVCFIDFAPTSMPPVGNYDVVRTYDFRPIFSITHKLAESGAKRFCFVGDPTHCQSFQERYLGMLAALGHVGVPHKRSDDILRADNFDYGSATLIKSELSKLRDLPDCFICANDYIARSVCGTLIGMGVEVPRRCAIVGFDNAPESYQTTPAITSFGCNPENLGSEAISTLISRIVSAPAHTRTVTVHVKQYLRATTERAGDLFNTPPSRSVPR